MKMYGYQKNDDNLMSLEEATLQCTYEELSKLAKFFKHSLAEFTDAEGNINNAHVHFKDWDTSWKEGESDLIIVVTNEKV